jgi:Undecaprenyl-phosphate galactose phosphotransferase WbaP
MAFALVAGVFHPLLVGSLGSAPLAWLWPVPPLLAGSFAVAGLYHRALTMHPVQELRLAGLLSTVVWAAYAATLALAGVAGAAMIGDLALLGGAGTATLLVARALSRILFARADWWGAPALVLASGAAGRAVVRNLQRWPEIGLRPVAVLQPEAVGENGNGAVSGSTGDGVAAADINGVPVLRDGKQAPRLMSACEIPYAIVSRPDLPHRERAGLVRRCSQFCRRVFVAPNAADGPALWTGQQAFQGFSGYGVRHVNGSRAAQLGKRAFDVVGALVALTLTAPLLAVLAALVKWDSSGPVFYRQLRIGRRGRCFNVLKFRSMYPDAEERLEHVLREDEALRAEYETFHKLKDDPRVTRLGAFLRRNSLDELPQFWNVLKGDMSLTGPRAYMPGELSSMDDLERVILQRRPGMSGLWQVSGRNALSFDERTRIDVHYVHHWSFWLDLYILARTVPVLFDGEHAV